ncbi:branched-chain amino acid ABC transporter permease [Sulfuritalea sp.]|uniref:branched-chain amino acid ABC transporter permease n=1 Tax=Sulfuritalea sp. TaxID=2480090 RepID=UPI00286E241B|nr:branched-chain amino acid ABC transporter permease [Sulfuritalea sp.]
MNFYLFIDLVVAGLVTGGIYAVVALGLNLQYGLMRIMNIAHGEFLMLGAYLTYTMVRLTGMSPLWFIPPMMVALFLLGLLLHRLIFRRLAATSPTIEAMESRSLIVGFGLMFIAQNAAQLIWGGGMSGQPYLDEAVKFGEITVAANRLLVLVVVAAASLALVLVLKKTLLGKAVRGMLQAPLGAMLVGIDTRKLHPACFGLGLALAGLAGGLLSMVYELTPAMGEPYTISALIVITLGGLGNIPGAIAGAVLLGLVETFGMYWTSPSLKILISYGVLVGVLLLRPKGLFTK